MWLIGGVRLDLTGCRRVNTGFTLKSPVDGLSRAESGSGSEDEQDTVVGESGPRDALLERTSAGGVVVNHLILHLTAPDLPFGGVGESGMGAYTDSTGPVFVREAIAAFIDRRDGADGRGRPPRA